MAELAAWCRQRFTFFLEKEPGSPSSEEAPSCMEVAAFASVRDPSLLPLAGAIGVRLLARLCLMIKLALLFECKAGFTADGVPAWYFGSWAAETGESEEYRHYLAFPAA